MMKRTTNGVAGHDLGDPKEHYVPVSKTPTTEAKVVWHVDPSALVGPREEEARRKAPEAKFLYAISAFLTLMVLWGIFRQVHYMVPQLFASSGGSGGGAAATLESSFSLDQIDSDAGAFKAVDESAIGGRKVLKHLLEMHAEQQHFVVEEQPRRRLFGISSQVHWDQQRERSRDMRGNGFLHREVPT